MSKLAYHVHVDDEHGETHVFGPDDALPAWAAKKITNPSAWEGGNVPTAVANTPATSVVPVSGSPDNGPGADPESTKRPYAKWVKADLQAEVDRRNADRESGDLIEVEGKGTAADLAAALEGDDAAQADTSNQG